MSVNLGKLRDMSMEQLQKEEFGLREKVWKLRMQTKMGQNQDPHKVREARRDLARVLTIIREQELAQAGGKGD